MDNENKDNELSYKQKKDFAQQLYISNPGMTQKEVAERAGVSNATIGRRISEGRWEQLRTGIVATKTEQLSRLYNHLKEFNNSIDARPADCRIMSPRDVDTLTKLTNAIRNLETETNIADRIEVGKEFLAYVRRVVTNAEQVKQIAVLFDGYIKKCL
ncbi:MAG: helix-turn-helix transcriptional regulator [Bacteroidales bacterium]|nr:helix-turn-helix transcriptional regulator [Bacteroidales bacterium]